MVREPQLFYHLEALMHPALFALAPSDRRGAKKQKDAGWTPAITFGSVHPGTMPTFRGLSLPLLAPAAVVQGLTDYLHAVYAMPFGEFSMVAGPRLARLSPQRHATPAHRGASVLLLPCHSCSTGCL